MTPATKAGPNLASEQALWCAGQHFVAGLDEAGRGAWAGPVVAAAVILPSERPDLATLLRGVNDSKQLTPRRRAALFPVICRQAVASGVGWVSAQSIDKRGIVWATQEAMRIAIHNMKVAPNALLIDALILPGASVPQYALIKGDARVLSIAAASILAKVFRDLWMTALDLELPGYGFAAHKGYGTAAHRAALDRLGSSREHRHSFAPLRRMTEQEPQNGFGV